MAIYVLFVYLVLCDTVKCWGYIASAEMWQDDYERKNGSKGEKLVMAYLKVLFRHLPGGTEGNHEGPLL
jgi:hypothetical protein